MITLQVYIVICADGKMYTGVTNDIERRIYEHNHSDDKKSYTYSRRPIKLLWHSDEMPPSEAIEFEKQIKGWRREKKSALIKGEWHKLPELARNSKYNIYNRTISTGSI